MIRQEFAFSLSLLSLSLFLYFTCNSKHFSHIFLCKIHFGFRICGTFQREIVAASRTSRAETVTKVTPLATFFFGFSFSNFMQTFGHYSMCVCTVHSMCNARNYNQNTNILEVMGYKLKLKYFIRYIRKLLTNLLLNQNYIYYVYMKMKKKKTHKKN